MKCTVNVIFLLLIPGVTFVQCKRDFSPSSPEIVAIPDTTQIPQVVRQKYLKDAARLTLRYMLNANTPDSNKVELDSKMLEQVYFELMSIYLAAERIPACDSVTHLYNIHTFPNPPLQEIIVMLDTSHGWTHAWLQYNPVSGNIAVDTIMQKYQINIEDVYGGVWVTLKSKIDLNTLALSNRLRTIAGIIYADPNWVIGDGNDITLNTENRDDMFIFSLKWGDCPAGCIYSHSWHISVSEGYAVNYLGSSGSPIPEELP